jgi:hypothetical protein
MPRAGVVGNPQPYEFFGTFAGLSFWPGSLTLLAAAPGIGKTSWLMRVVNEASASGYSAAIACYEHTAEELKFRLRRQAEAAHAGPHKPADELSVEQELAKAGQAVLLSLSDQEDTIRALEEILIEDYGFPPDGPALLAVDYLQRMPVVGLSGHIPEETRSGAAAAGLRALARHRGWAIVAASALRFGHFADGHNLSALLGDERVAYEADRVLLIRRIDPVHNCGCSLLEVATLKDRAGPILNWQISFWGARFYPALEGEGSHP